MTVRKLSWWAAAFLGVFLAGAVLGVYSRDWHLPFIPPGPGPNPPAPGPEPGPPLPPEPAPEPGGVIVGRVTEVISARGFFMRKGFRHYVVTLDGVGPPSGPAFEKARCFLEDYLTEHGRRVELQVVEAGEDIVCGVAICRGVNLNREIVRCGWARAVGGHDPELAVLEKAAREAKIGMWATEGE